jgi:teichuronic acid biosynthesis glycosyltransferase TuaG
MENSMVSIIMPFYNEGLYLSRAIEGIVQQTHQDWELLLLNDGSTDNSQLIAQGWADTDDRIKVYLSETNRGQVITINWGMTLASGQFLAFCDADDVWLPYKLEKQLLAIYEYRAHVVCGRSQYCMWAGAYVSSPTPAYGQINYNDMLGGNRIGFSTLLIHRNNIQIPEFTVLKNGLIHHDFVFLLQLFQHNPDVVVFEIPEVVCKIGLRDGLSANKWKAIQSQWWILRRVARLSVLLSLKKMYQYMKFVLRKRGLKTLWQMLKT